MRNCLVILCCSLAACGFSNEIPPDGPLPTIFVGFEAATSDADEKSSAHRVKIKLSEVSTQSISVKYAIAGGTADPTNDYGIVTMETMVFPPGETEFLLTVAVKSDTIEEAAETISIQLVAPTNALLAPSADTHEITILAKALPRVSFMTASADLQEPMDPTVQVVLDEPSEFPITVQYAMTSATATAGMDYTQVAGMVTFAPMETMKPLTLDVLDDVLDEDDEPIVVTLDMPTNAFLDDPKKTFTHTILDNLVDPAPSVQFNIGASTVSEAGTTATIVVNLTAVSGRTITVPFTLANASTATATADFTLGTASPLTIPPMTATTSIIVNIVNDTTDDEAEIVQLDLGAPTNATVGTPAAHALTITDDDNVCFGPANTAFDVCFTTTPPVNAVNLGGGAINTNAGSSDCSALTIDFGPNQDPACFIVGTSITVNGAYSVTGTRPLVLVAIGNIAVNNMIDASSKQSGAQGPGSNSGSCTAGTNGQNDTQGGGGGAGASFMSAGNNGGTGDNGDANAGVAALADANPPTKLRGGCNGMKGGNANGGAGGRGGGAVYLVAGGDITAGPNGGINVSGAGGNGGSTNDGGGGGGAGGMVMFYAAGNFNLNNSTKVVANGGGGGGGGDNGAAGGAGSDPVAQTETTPAGGGSSGGLGTGGAGFAGATAAAVGGNGNSNQGGGGGGGGGGYIRSNQAFGNADVSAGSIQVVP